MRTDFRRAMLMAGIVGLLGASFSDAGDHLRRRVHGADCECTQSAPAVVHAAPIIESAGEISSVAQGCCGTGGGLAQLGSLYGFSSVYGFSGGGYSHGSATPGSFLSGYEGLPNMDGGGIHHRYPYHSYRRPWAFPGTPSTNVTIVW